MILQFIFFSQDRMKTDSLVTPQMAPVSRMKSCYTIIWRPLRISSNNQFFNCYSHMIEWKSALFETQGWTRMLSSTRFLSRSEYSFDQKWQKSKLYLPSHNRCENKFFKKLTKSENIFKFHQYYSTFILSLIQP